MPSENNRAGECVRVFAPRDPRKGRAPLAAQSRGGGPLGAVGHRPSPAAPAPCGQRKLTGETVPLLLAMS